MTPRAPDVAAIDFRPYIEAARRQTLPSIPDPVGDAARQAFPDSAPLRGPIIFATIEACGSQRLRDLVEGGIVLPTSAYELCRLPHELQDEVLRLGRRAVRYIAREIYRAALG